MRVVWTVPAARDLDAIGEYIARQNPSAAQRIIRRITVRTKSLATHPYLGRPGRVTNTRELVVTSTPFIVAYRIISDRIEILAVFHGARKWPDTF
jgi:toxin ParE1/3/4